MTLRMTDAEVAAHQARLKARRGMTIPALEKRATGQASATETPSRGKRRGEMNKTEAAFAAEVLARGKADGVVTTYYYEPFTLRLANGARYTPDFFVHHASGELTFVEVKGFWRPAERLRIKWAAQRFPMFTFLAVMKRKKKDGGGWAYESIPASD